MTRSIQMRQIAIAATLSLAAALLFASPSALAAPADDAPDEMVQPPRYQDDRSTPESLVRSLYNAIDRREYLRAWSYFADEPGRADFESFQAGYTDTDRVSLRVGAVTSEGAAGHVYSQVPVVIEAVSPDGTATVFTGCYRTRFTQAGNQAMPPFVPLQIEAGTLEPADAAFEVASGRCEETPR